MIKKSVFLLAIIVQVAFAQPLKWLKTYGDSVYSSAGRGVWQAADSTIYLLGSQQTAGSIYQTQLLKTTATGRLIWQKTLAIDGYHFANGFTPTPDGRLAIIGITQQDFSGISDVFLAWTDTAGTLLDTVFWGAPEKNENLTHIELLPDSGFICTGIRSQPDLQSNDAYLVRLDKHGQIVWEKNYGGPGNEVGHMVTALPDGFAFSTDEYRGTTFIQGFPYTDYDVALTRTDLQGNVLWKTEIGDSNVNGNIAMHRTHFGDFLLVGESTTPQSHAFDIFTARVGSGGNLHWIRYIGGDGTDTGFALTETDAHTTLVAGYTNSYDPQKPIQMHLTRLDSSGVAIDMQLLPNPGVSLAYGMAKAQNGHYLVVGTSDGKIALAEVADTAFSDSFRTITTFLAMLDGPVAPLSMQVWPNPAQGLCHLHLPENFLVTSLAITDLTGKKWTELVLLPGNELVLPAFAPGFYLLHASDQQARRATCRLLVE